jgi:hypothetical protein
MHTIIHELRNGGVGGYAPNPDLIASMMGVGLGWSEPYITQAIANLIVPVSSEASANGKVTYTNEMAREWVLAVASGGLTENQALDLFARRIQERNGYGANAVVDIEDLPYHMKGNGNPDHIACPDPDCHDRYFRDALLWDSTVANRCRCDMGKAQAVHMGCIRVVRNAELAAKDITFMRAVEAGDTSAQTTIGTEKQTLRDLPATFDITTDVDTPEKLKAKWPTELPARE